jgi:hypothetical protein
MKYYAVVLSILFSYFISGCEDTAVDTDLITKQNKVRLTQKQSTTEIKKQHALPHPVKSTVTSKQSEIILTDKIKPPQSKTEDNPVLTEQSQKKAVLNLSVPDNTQKPTGSDRLSGESKKNYLPDLFADKKEKNDSSLQLDGKIIKKEELSVDKERSVDGAGVDFKITY